MFFVIAAIIAVAAAAGAAVAAGTSSADAQREAARQAGSSVITLPAGCVLALVSIGRLFIEGIRRRWLARIITAVGGVLSLSFVAAGLLLPDPLLSSPNNSEATPAKSPPAPIGNLETNLITPGSSAATPTYQVAQTPECFTADGTPISADDLRTRVAGDVERGANWDCVEGLVLITDTPQPILTAMFVLRTNANCRIGASVAHRVITAFPADTRLPIVGRDSSSTWYWVEIPSGGNCWIAASTGDPFGLNPEIPVIFSPTVTPTPTLQPIQTPQPPANAYIIQTCNSQDYMVELVWFDAADNEAGFRIIRNGAEVALLGADSSGFIDHPPYGGPYNYTIEAYNPAGASGVQLQDPGCLP